jgi:hypothetical protein
MASPLQLCGRPWRRQSFDALRLGSAAMAAARPASAHDHALAAVAAGPG